MIGILGSMHTDEMRQKFNFSLDQMRDVILRFRPDIICGEIREIDFLNYANDQSYGGYLGPSEYKQLILNLCLQENIEFFPVDWFDDELSNIDFDEGKSKEDIDIFGEKMGQIINQFIQVGASSELPFNSIEFNHVAREKQELQRAYQPKLQSITWDKRNLEIMKNINEVIKKNTEKRILIIFGAEHSYFFIDQISKDNIEIIFPLR